MRGVGWALFLLLHCVVVAKDAPLPSRWIGRGAHEALRERGASGFAEEVLIGDLDEQVKRSRVLLDVAHFLRSQRAVIRCVEHLPLAREENAFAWLPGVSYRVLWFGMKSLRKHSVGRLLLEVLGGGVPVVRDSHGDAGHCPHFDHWYAKLLRANPSALVIARQFVALFNETGIENENAKRQCAKARGYDIEYVPLSLGWRWHGWPVLLTGLVLMFFGLVWINDGLWFFGQGYGFPWGLRRLLLGVSITLAGCWFFFQGVPALCG